MHEKQKNCYVVSIEHPFGLPITHEEYVGSELGFRVWYNRLLRNYKELHKGAVLRFSFYFYPVMEG